MEDAKEGEKEGEAEVAETLPNLKDRIRAILSRLSTLVSIGGLSLLIAAIALFFQIKDSGTSEVNIDSTEIEKAVKLQTPVLDRFVDLNSDPLKLTEFLDKNEDKVIQLSLTAPWPEDYEPYDGMPREHAAENLLFVGRSCVDSGSCTAAEITFSGACENSYCGHLDSAGNRVWKGYVVIKGTGWSRGIALYLLKFIPPEEARLRK
ncbi:hypothetical protein [Sphingopyxis sp.]|uniref:hypothetical protein n=1 Tax=Sphingopyxis sp. TaxID=1908224 RepID=UPI002EDA546C